MGNNAIPFLICPWQKAGNIFKYEQRNIKTVTETDKSSTFNRRLYIQYSRHKSWLICDNANTSASQTSKPYNDIFSIALVNLEKRGFVRNFFNYFPDIIRHGSRLRNDRIKPLAIFVFQLILISWRLVFTILRHVVQ